MNPCKLGEPKVINNELLERCVVQQGPRSEAGRLAEIEGVHLDEVQQIRLEFMKILRIDHLWVLTALTKLSLNNNLLEKIENLHTLIHLVELDLSFNKIVKIENLDALIKLEKLSLFDNRIQVLENMDTLTNLTILSIGRNRIDELDNVLYLRPFTKLKSLNMVENPCSETENFRLFIAVFLPQVVFYEYRLVQDHEKELGAKAFSSKLRALNEVEEKERETKERLEKERADAELHSLSFVEYLNTTHLWDLLFVDDVEGKTLLQMGDEAKEFYDEYEEQFIDLCKQIFDVGQVQYKIRKNELDQFTNCIHESKQQNQDYSIKYMDTFMEKKAGIFLEVKKIQEMFTSNEIVFEEYVDKCDVLVEQYEKVLHELWKGLMKLEMELYEQMEEVNQNFEHSMTELVNVFLEAAQALFSQMRALEVTYAENISEAALRYQTTANLNEDFVIPNTLKPIMADKDVLHNALAGSHDMHMQLIDNREDTLVGRSKQWLSDLVENLGRNEIKRNRIKILEINQFLDIQRDQFDDLQGEYGGDMKAEADALLE